MTTTFAQGRSIGEARKLLGMELAALRKEHAIKKAQFAMINAALSRDDRTCSADDIPTNLAAEYEDGEKWVGSAVLVLALRRIIVCIGHCKSARPSRHANEIKVWKILDEDRANRFRQELRLWLDRNPLPPDDDADSLFKINPKPQNQGPAVTVAGPR